MLDSILLTVLLLGFNVAAYKDPHCEGNRHGIVHLFEWKWNDIAAECERFLGPMGFCGVQTSPPSENRVVTGGHDNRPWWERYQPVSFKIETRSGNEQEFKSMVERCNKVGLRVYADAVVNQVAIKGTKGIGTGGTFFDAKNLQFPGIPYGPSDFNDASTCHSHDGNLHDYGNAEEVRNCRVQSMLDVKLSKPSVQVKVAHYLDHLIDLGITGFRLDAAQNMWPEDVAGFLERAKDLPMGGRPFVWQQISEKTTGVSEGEYFFTGRVTNFRFGLELAKIFRRQNPLKDLSKVYQSRGMLPDSEVMNDIDNQDTQRFSPGILTHMEPRSYKMASAFLLAWPYGVPHIMSSFEFNETTHGKGPPHNEDMSIKDVEIVDGMCTGEWVCEHRWRPIYNMVAFKNMATGTKVENWWSGTGDQIAFSRGDKAFIAFNLEDSDLNENLATGLPSGEYCDVISGFLENGVCTGNSVHVGNDGRADIHVCSSCDVPVVAIHIGAKVGDVPKRY